MLNVWLAVINLVLLAAALLWACSCHRAMHRMKRARDEELETRVALRVALVRARNLADYQDQVCREYRRCWTFWQAAAFRAVWDAHPEVRQDVAAVQARLLAHNAIAVERIEQAIKGLRQ